MKSCRSLRLAAIFALAGASAFAAGVPLNSLTPAEKKAGWRLLFDGKTLAGWHALKQSGPPARGWVVQDGVLNCVPGSKGADLFSDQLFDNFEFSWDWAMPAKSNNGVKYFILEERGPIGHEYQMIDDSIAAGHAESTTASFYLVVAPDAAKTKVKPFGDWNHSRIVVKGDHVEHWLNGEMVVEYECGSPAILEQVKKTKFKTTEGFGRKVRGHLLLTNHNSKASFRNLKVRELPAK